MYYSALTTLALFIAIIINDVIQNDTSSISNHAFFGLLSILAVLFLCMKGAESVAWGLIILPMFTIALSFVLSHSNSDSSYTNNNYYSQPAQTTPLASSQLSKPATIQLPVSTTSASSQLPNQATIQLPVSTTPASNSSNITPSGAGCSVNI